MRMEEKKSAHSALTIDRAAFLLLRVKKAFKKKKLQRKEKEKNSNADGRASCAGLDTGLVRTGKTPPSKPPLLRSRTLPAIVVPGVNILQAQIQAQDGGNSLPGHLFGSRVGPAARQHTARLSFSRDDTATLDVVRRKSAISRLCSTSAAERSGAQQERNADGTVVLRVPAPHVVAARAYRMSSPSPGSGTGGAGSTALYRLARLLNQGSKQPPRHAVDDSGVIRRLSWERRDTSSSTITRSSSIDSMVEAVWTEHPAGPTFTSPGKRGSLLAPPRLTYADSHRPSLALVSPGVGRRMKGQRGVNEFWAIFLLLFISASAHHEVHLIHADRICANVKSDHNILLPSPADCPVLYKCENGMALPSSCPPKLHWCEALTKCILPLLANCTIGHVVVTYPPGEEPTVTPGVRPTTQPTTVSTIKTPVVGQDLCPENGATMPNYEDCHTYWLCTGDTFVKKPCPKGSYYSCWDQKCLSSSSAQCKPTSGQKCNNSGHKLANPQDCTTYYQCIDNVVQLEHCENRTEFNAWFKECVSNDLSHCKVTTTSTPSVPTPAPNPTSDTCPYELAKLPDLSDCHSFYICVNKLPVEQTCPSNTIYSCWDQICLPAESGICVTNPNQSGQHCTDNNSAIPDANHCGSYYKCVNGTVVQEHCPIGLEYNKWYSQCVAPQISHCQHTTTAEPTTQKPSVPTPAPNPIIDTCPYELAKLPDLTDCHSFYICINKLPVKQSCPSNTIYSCWDQICLPSESGICVTNPNQTGQHCVDNNTSMPDAYHCGSYYKCVNGTVVQKHCPFGLEYNKWYSKCVAPQISHCQPTTTTEPTIQKPCVINPNIAANPMCSGPNSDTYIYPHYTNCNQYMKCDCNRHLETFTCQPPEFHYNCESKVCVNMTHCCSPKPATTPGTLPNSPTTTPITTLPTTTSAPLPNCPKEGARIANPTICSQYYQCVKGEPTLKTCPNGQIYSYLDEECRNPSEGLCINVGSPVGLSCKREGLRVQNIQSCTSYFTCLNGKVVTEYCPTGFKYNNWYLVCSSDLSTQCQTYTTVLPSTTTTTTTTVEAHLTTKTYEYNVCKGKEEVPSMYDCSKYLVCEKEYKKFRRPVLHSCFPGQNYDAFSGRCVEAGSARCGSQMEMYVGQSCPKNGVDIPNAKDCSSYYSCKEHIIQKIDCPHSKQYDIWSKKCKKTSEVTCILEIPNI